MIVFYPIHLFIVDLHDIQLAAVVTPALTRVRVDKYNMGCEAVNRLVPMFDDQEASFSPIQLSVELMARESA